MLQFAVTDAGEPVSISQIAEARASGARGPHVHCPACRQALIAKLGSVVTHHFAHRPAPEPCFGSTGEGALHFSAKLALQRGLTEMTYERTTVSIAVECASCESKITASAFSLAPGDVVRVESWLDPLRTLKPDVSVWRGELRVGLVEVVATHPCGDAKIAALTAFGVPMVEVAAETIIGAGGAQLWNQPAPIDASRTVSVAVPELCGSCETRHQEQALEHERAREAEAKRSEEAAERLRTTPRTEILKHCWVHGFMPDGTRRDACLVVERDWRMGEWIEYRLRDLKSASEPIRTWKTVDVQDAPAAAMETIRSESRAYARQRTHGCLKLETYGGFQDGPAPSREPFPALWWSTRDGKWVPVEFERGLGLKLGVSEDAIDRQITSGRFRRIQVKLTKFTPKVLDALEAEGVHRFGAWLREKNGGKLPVRRPRRTRRTRRWS